MAVTSSLVPARAGLAGHPSDAFAGAVVAAPIPELTATVAATTADHIRIGDRAFGDVDEILSGPHDGETGLLTATVARLVAWRRAVGLDVPGGGLELTWTTTIPRSVGLAGSSALVVGALRAVAAHWGVVIPDEVGPRLAWEVETELLGIAAGPQDRVVQWHAAGHGPHILVMDFRVTPWAVRSIQPPAPLALFVCWTAAGRQPSGAVHAPLQARRHEPAVRSRMVALAAAADEAAAALQSGDIDALGRCMDAGFDHRRALFDLDPAHVALVEGLRGLGAAVTYAGSGGAVVALAADLDPLRRWADERSLPSVTTVVS